jgi:hypothetical protein
MKPQNTRVSIVVVIIVDNLCYSRNAVDVAQHCGCHILPEEHDCLAIPFNMGWNEYAHWQEKLS